MAPSEPIPLPSTPDLSVPAREGFLQKTLRRSIEEPLIPLGLVLTCAAFVGAARAIRKQDHARANLMFRRRIYAQGFTVVVMVAGSYYWRDERAKRKELETMAKEREAVETREAWLKELEARELEDKEARGRVEVLRERRRKRRDEEVKKKVESEVDLSK
jgi:hypothetical protein